MNGSAAWVLPVFFPFGKKSEDFEYGGIKKIDNLFGQFQLPPPFSGWKKNLPPKKKKKKKKKKS